MPSAMSLSAYFINYTGGTVFTSVQINSSSPHFLTILTQTTVHPPVLGHNNNQGNKISISDDGKDEDSFGEHYFHICIYIWACVVISSLIALSVKWGCCGRSLTRWEVKRIPLKRFQRVEGEDSQDRCPICHEEFHEERLIRQLPCNHCYHSYCVDRWLVKMSNRCPLCKQRVSISVLCPWNKQRRKKEITGQLAPDMEASVDESPPLPPLATLTPSNWYGEEIMSGPSKFIILRPGRPTRVIDVRKQKKLADSDKTSIETGDAAQAGQGNAFENLPQSFAAPGTEQICNSDVGNISSSHTVTKDVIGSSPEETENLLQSDTRSACSSRSCSVSSDHSELLPSQACSCGSESEAQDFDELMPGGNNLMCNTALLCVVHSQENNHLTQFSHSQPELGNVPPKEYRSTARALPFSSRGDSLISVSSVVSDTKPACLSPYPSRGKYTTSHSASLAVLNRSECSPSSAFCHKRHTLPGAFAEKLTLLQFIPSNISDDVIHGGFVSALGVNNMLDHS